MHNSAQIYWVEIQCDTQANTVPMKHQGIETLNPALPEPTRQWLQAH